VWPFLSQLGQILLGNNLLYSVYSRVKKMLAALPVKASAEQRFRCLDLLKVTFEDASWPATEDAVLLEVWEAGGLLQTDRDIPPGVSFRLACGKESVPATVRSSSKDEYGYLVEFVVGSASSWFPEGYQPPYLRRGPAPQD
jgi:hypothetical protein